MVCFGLLLAAATALTAGCSAEGESAGGNPAAGASAGSESPASGLSVSSPAFGHGAAIPKKHACAAQGGEDVSPPLAWSGVPSKARELAIVVDDPDAPGGSYIHWIVTGIPASKTGLSEGATEGKVLPGSGGKAAYAGPCPPSGVHHYHFIVYALGEPIQVSGDPQEAHVKIKDAAIATGETVGTWAR
ncbi:YbhB/YbcL family Raf kinase inhibitor-like protein [Sphaerisporangium perillae]|uniref:YbhB/YbcL family Raf kinase inhibitor-like protein n=1 Tax=Sphaerisporangium perillae TaxID=2935860 RepID=UPI00200DA619|nr:YbhB/YbcL family Raf kinase inhibitor-like protein [Sphaerisporangium perillae]